ncbi:MAG: cupin domain-containing protein [Thermoleophilia bacterium]
MESIERPEWDEIREQDGFHARRSRIGRRLGTERLGISLWELPPGQAAYPYHLHLHEEELVVVLVGRPWLRSPDGWRRLEQGEVVSFPRGPQGAHQIANRDEEPVRFISLSTNGETDVALYPDSGKVGVAERPSRGGGLIFMFDAEAAVDYWRGEAPPPYPDEAP